MNKTIGEKLFEHRKNAGFSQEELAEKIGVSRQAVSKWERDESSPDTNNLIALAKLYNISLDELVLTDNNTQEREPSSNNTVDITSKGIQVKNSAGDKVNIGWKGIHVDTADSSVHIDKNNVNVTKNGHIVHVQEHYDSRLYRFFNSFPYPLITVVVYILFGYFDICGGWDIGWLVFLTIPLYYTLITAIAHKNAGAFAYPVLATMIYLYLGMVYEMWHPGWIIFLSIPIYYFIAEFIKKLCKKI